MIRMSEYHGWQALTLETDAMELVVPLEVGPRVIHAGFKGGDNLFAVQEEQLGQKDEADWQIRGGHRLWHAPEARPRTYVPDNEPVASHSEESGNLLMITQPVETGTLLQKQLQIEIINPTTFKVTHRLSNHGLWPVEASAWALSVMKRGGYAAIPLPPKGDHATKLLPEYSLVPWPYTDLGAPCWDFHNSFIGLDTTQVTASQKIGLTRYPGWAAYWQDAGTMVKFSPVNKQALYPDLGCPFEAFACDWMIEMETLSPLARMEYGEDIRYVEYWGFFRNLPKPDSEETFQTSLLPAVDSWLKETRA